MKIDGNKLKAAREAAGVTRSDLASVAELSHVRIWQIEQVNVIVNMNSHVVKSMAKLLKVKPQDLAA